MASPPGERAPGAARSRLRPPLSVQLCQASGPGCRVRPAQDSYLVDSASSHMLVSKIKPCISKYKQSIR